MVTRRTHAFDPWTDSRRSVKRAAIHALNVFTVEEYESNGKAGKRWTNIGAAFPHKEGVGFSIELKAFPIDGRTMEAHEFSDRLLLMYWRENALRTASRDVTCVTFPASTPGHEYTAAVNPSMQWPG